VRGVNGLSPTVMNLANCVDPAGWLECPSCGAFPVQLEDERGLFRCRACTFAGFRSWDNDSWVTYLVPKRPASRPQLERAYAEWKRRMRREAEERWRDPAHAPSRPEPDELADVSDDGAALLRWITYTVLLVVLLVVVLATTGGAQ
jgi:hypothetical protein